ncbi:hypothetical protein PSTEL_13620 [Paenibacillus stellifer]|uniref:Uncharacterized protein n=1 Tax=Paenibacillus stellifer TaxID=169760 RepID=A0A089LSW3_9BACL|nr:hypothetical protein [Paenibacillus stellifer]AIQ63972.1 hypothetical protein PSTEL_13620 [Paenibacillus stellifer]
MRMFNLGHNDLNACAARFGGSGAGGRSSGGSSWSSGGNQGAEVQAAVELGAHQAPPVEAKPAVAAVLAGIVN